MYGRFTVSTLSEDPVFMKRRHNGTDSTQDAVDSVLPLHRVGTPEEIAEAVQFLGCDKAGYITGHVLTVDGGLTAGWPLNPES